MNRLGTVIFVTLLFISVHARGDTTDTPGAGNAETSARLRELASMLAESPRGFGIPIDDRTIWSRIAAMPAFREAVKNAERLATRPVPELPDDLYLDFSRTGNRRNYETPLGERRSTLTGLVFGECIDNRGRFIPAIEQYIRAIFSEKTWVLPAHDRELRNFNRAVIEIDLMVAMTSWEIATAYYLLGEHLSPEVRQLINTEMHRRTFDPFLAMVQGKSELLWWMTATSNWNSVCLSGVVGSALAMIGSRDDRAWFLLGVEQYAPNFLKGFTEDGYCSEGLAYWNYGFGHYIMLAEAVRQATDGTWDLFDNPKVKTIAGFPINLEILDGVYPAFADCPPDTKPSSRYMRYLNRRFNFGMDAYEHARRYMGGQLYEAALFEISDPLSDRASTGLREASRGQIRSWFSDAGILICRPSPGVNSGIGVALKGGHNAELHNHNDVGSFVVALDGRALILDPGGEVYTKRTFSADRYVSNVLNSFGHPVPLVAGHFQKTGAEARARVLSTVFTDSSDTIVFDIAPAYDVPELKSLVRTFMYSREGRCSLTVTDHVVFSGAQGFETALITFSGWRRLDDGSLLVNDGDSGVNIAVKAAGSEFRIDSGEIHEDLPSKKYPVRLGITLTQPVTEAEIILTITPASPEK